MIHLITFSFSYIIMMSDLRVRVGWEVGLDGGEMLMDSIFLSL